MSLFPRGRAALAAVLLAAAPAALLLSPSAAAAQSVKAGPFYLKNTSGQEFTVGNPTYTDPLGNEKTVRGACKIAARSFSPLTHDGKKLVCSKIKIEVTTGEGTTVHTFACRVLDEDGDFVGEVTAADYARHLELLGGPPPAAPVAAGKPAAGPTGPQIQDGVVKTLFAVVQHVAIREIENDPEPSFLQLVLAQTLRQTRDETVGAAVKDLFPQLSVAEKAKVRQMVCLAFDGNLTPANLTALEAKERLIADLRKVNPDFGTAAEVADFLYQVQGKRR